MDNNIFDHEGHLLSGSNSYLLRRMARGLDTPVKILQDIWINRANPEIDSNVLFELANNLSTPIEILKEIWVNRADEKINSDVLFGLAGNHNTPATVLQDIWENRTNNEIDSYVLCALVRNPSTPIEILKEIWKNRTIEKINLYVLYKLAKNPSTPIEILEDIWVNEKINSHVLSELAKNPSTPIKILEDIWVNRADRKINSDVLSGLAKNPSTPIEILEDIWVNRRINNKIDSDVLSELAEINRPLPYSIVFDMLREGQYTPSCLIPGTTQFNRNYYTLLSDSLLVLKSEKYKSIQRFLVSNYQNIKRELNINDRKLLLSKLIHDIPEEKLPIVFNVLQQINEEEPKRLTTSRALYGTLTYDKIMTRIKEALEQTNFREERVLPTQVEHIQAEAAQVEHTQIEHTQIEHTQAEATQIEPTQVNSEIFEPIESQSPVARSIALSDDNLTTIPDVATLSDDNLTTIPDVTATETVATLPAAAVANSQPDLSQVSRLVMNTSARRLNKEGERSCNITK